VSHFRAWVSSSCARRMLGQLGELRGDVRAPPVPAPVQHLPPDAHHARVRCRREVELLAPDLVIEEFSRNRERIEQSMTTSVADRFKLLKKDLVLQRHFGVS
jgi:hypothetical protein